MIPKLELNDNPSHETRQVILDGLLRFNTERLGRNMTPAPLAVVMTNPDSGEVIGGLWGRTGPSHLFIELIFIPENLRQSGIGTRLMRMAEGEAARRGCTGAWLDTFSFQARGFYEKLGYSVFGTIEDYPPGHARYFLKKTFKAARP